MGKHPIKVNGNFKYSSDKAEQNKAIKRRLAGYYKSLDETARPSVYALQRALAEQPDGFAVSYTTLNDLLSEEPTDTTPNLHLVIALCRYWHLDYAAVLAPASQDVKIAPSAKAFTEHMTVLRDEGYFGTFYGYMYSKNIKRAKISEFTLSINSTGDSASARLTIRSTPENVKGDRIEYQAVYTGIPFLISRKDVIFMTLTDERGQFYTLFMDYRHYNIDKLYYRKGIAVTAETESNKPLLCNYVLFQARVSKEKQKDLIPGLLPLTGDSFWVKEKDLKELESEEEMAAFFHDYEHNWQHSKETMYRISISHVLTSIVEDTDETEQFRVIKALLRLNEKAQAPVRIEYENPDGMPGFAKKILQR
ncbi:MAG TPA: hypothetical protein IAA06_06455 [Candidatus Blautia faecavium]|uniref:Uncharacterized protein n=1 Tax=Candidatus Blautia faecavium TaxID=2838487 RepID=A0A9D2LSS5_9FIRM|nr:hypothetical protein [Candidatus Blautia faecavium]